MLSNANRPLPSWNEIDSLVSRWLKDRQQLIVLYCKVDGLKEFAAEKTPLSVRINALCDVLIDYVSAGHFEVYKYLMQEAEQFEKDYRTTINRLLPQIQSSTEIALDFNDRYSADIDDDTMNRLPKDLNELGVRMVERFELEDQLIAQLHTCHRDLVA